MLVFSLSCCSAEEDNPPNWVEDSVDEYSCTKNLDVYKLSSNIVRKIIDEAILPDLKSRGEIECVYIHEIIVDEIPYLCFTNISVDGTSEYIDRFCGWLKIDGYEFIVHKSAKRFFTETSTKHLFKYIYSPEGEDCFDTKCFIIEECFYEADWNVYSAYS